MKYVCFGYLDVDNWAKKSASEQNAMIDECTAYDDFLKKNGNWGQRRGPAVRYHAPRSERQSFSYGRSICRDQGTTGRPLDHRGERSQRRHPVDIETPGRENGHLGDSPRRGHDRNDSRVGAAALRYKIANPRRRVFGVPPGRNLHQFSRLDLANRARIPARIDKERSNRGVSYHGEMDTGVRRCNGMGISD